MAEQSDSIPRSISSLAFTYRRLVMAVVFAMMAYGLVSYFTIPAREDPHIIIRQAFIQTLYPGMPADRVELLITKTLEESIIELPEIEEIRSSSLPGQSIIHVEIFDRFTHLEQIWDNVREQVEAARAALPEGTQPPQVNDRFGDVAVITLALTAPGYSQGAMFDIAQHVRDILYDEAGTEKIDILGEQEERIYLEFSSQRLAQLGLSATQLRQVLQQQNIILPGGIIETDHRRFVVHPTGNYDSLEALKETLIPLANGENLPLQDVVNVRYGSVDPPQQAAYFNGKPAIMFAITMLDDANILEYSPRMKARIAEVAETLPAGFSLDIATFQAEQVETAVHGVTINVLETLFIVMLVVVLFLGLRIGLIVGAIVPTVMLATLTIMSFSGVELERMSLATLIISLGLLVDNGIVVAEDFIQRMEVGTERLKAVALTGRELAIPLLTSSLTTILVFMPLMLAEHVAGEYTRSVSLVILITLSTSWVIALMVTPTLCYYFSGSHNKKNEAESPQLTKRLFDAMNRQYQRLLIRILKHRLLFLLFIVIALVLTVVMAGMVRQEFFPDSDRTQIIAYVDLPADGSSIMNDRVMRDIFAMLEDKQRFPHLKNTAGYVGFGGPRFVLTLTPVDPVPNKGFLVMNIDRVESMDQMVLDLRDAFRQTFPDIRVRVMRMFLGPEDSSVIQIQVKGPDANYIYQASKQVEALLHDIPHTIDIFNDWEGFQTQLNVEIDQQRARRAGVTSAEIANTLNRYYSGEAISEFREGDDIYPIVMRAMDRDRHDPATLGALNVYSESRQQNVPLYQVAEITKSTDFARRERETLMRTVTVEARNLAMNAEELKPVMDKKLQPLIDQLPPNTRIEYDGVIQVSQEAQVALQAYLPLCLGLIFICIIWQFNSWRRTLIIFITLPLLVIGGIMGLLIFSAPFGFMVTLGFYALAGILANNAIVLIDRIDLERHEGQSATDWEAVISASVRRLRPIIMSTVTTVLGLLPLILTQDVLFYGMAAAIAMGLLVGTVLTLGLVPVLYTYFFKISPN